MCVSETLLCTASRPRALWTPGPPASGWGHPTIQVPFPWSLSSLSQGQVPGGGLFGPGVWEQKLVPGGLHADQAGLGRFPRYRRFEGRVRRGECRPHPRAVTAERDGEKDGSHTALRSLCAAHGDVPSSPVTALLSTHHLRAALPHSLQSAAWGPRVTQAVPLVRVTGATPLGTQLLPLCGTMAPIRKAPSSSCALSFLDGERRGRRGRRDCFQCLSLAGPTALGQAAESGHHVRS